ncbi:MAG TPA: HupE/UreJ family protein [Thermoanaerobaculia bacterium]|nr:HupE/UreJ family protein [Thermoanaerobaculia bacterium]
MRRLFAVLLLCIAVRASAHELGMVQVEATFHKDGTFAVDLVVDPEHVPPYATSASSFLRDVAKSAVIAFDGKRVPFTQVPVKSTRLRLTGRTPQNVSRFTFSDPEILGYFVLSLQNEGQAQKVTQWVEGGKTSEPFALDRAVVPLSRWSIVRLYLALGFTHILPRGLDHVLFVLGIFLLAVKLKPVLWQVSAFTLAHTITLALTVYGVVSLPPRIVEPLIALSIVYVAVENVFTSTLHAWRPLIVFCFGLLHGMGFAGVLTEIGLPRSEFVPALLAFNAGVECGQLTVILVAFLVVGLPFRKKPWYRQRIVIPGSLLIAATGLYWFVQRALL